jgi:hypothetical protein
LPHVKITFATPMHGRGKMMPSEAEVRALEAPGRIFSSADHGARTLDLIVETIELDF